MRLASAFCRNESEADAEPDSMQSRNAERVRNEENAIEVEHDEGENQNGNEDCNEEKNNEADVWRGTDQLTTTTKDKIGKKRTFDETKERSAKKQKLIERKGDKLMGKIVDAVYAMGQMTKE